MDTKKKGLVIIKKLAMNSAKSAMNSACIGFCYQPISPRKKQMNKSNG